MKVLKAVSGRAVEFGGEPHQGWLPMDAAIPGDTSRRAVTLDLRLLEDADGAVVLEWQSREGDDSGDRWYPNEAAALREASELFGVDPAEWGSNG